MPRRIRIESLGKEFEFPDGTSDEEIDHLVETEIIPSYAAKVPASPAATAMRASGLEPAAPMKRPQDIIKPEAGLGTRLASKVQQGLNANQETARGLGGLAEGLVTSGPLVGGARQLYGDAEALYNGGVEGLKARHDRPFSQKLGEAVGFDEQRFNENLAAGEPERAAVNAAFPVATAIAGIKSGIKGSPVERAAKPQMVQQRAMGIAAKLPPRAVSGAEDFIRAAAPTGKNVGFRENVYVAAGDLAEIGHKVELAEVKGGIINPDMRMRATADAVRAHMQEMYATERAPQIQAIADRVIDMKVGRDAVEGLNYLKRSGGTAEIRDIATKALEARKLTGAELDQLAIVANENLRGFERLTAADKMQNSMTNRRLGSIKQLDREIGAKLDSALKDAGQPGIRSYERRYAALGEIEHQLNSRVNETELNQPGRIKGVIKPVVGALTSGKSGVASASQASVADVRIGHKLQTGLKKLKESGIKAQR